MTTQIATSVYVALDYLVENSDLQIDKPTLDRKQVIQQLQEEKMEASELLDTFFEVCEGPKSLCLLKLLTPLQPLRSTNPTINHSLLQMINNVIE